jgi:hypothetical protein
LKKDLSSLSSTPSIFKTVAMKKTFLTLSFWVFIISCALSQNIPLYPIPSYNIPVFGWARFEPSLNSGNSITRGKVIQNVAIRGGTGSHAHVRIYSLDGLNVLGPYIVYAGETLTVEIDDREWGVLVETEDDIEVSVWVTNEP